MTDSATPPRSSSAPRTASTRWAWAGRVRDTMTAVSASRWGRRLRKATGFTAALVGGLIVLPTGFALWWYPTEVPSATPTRPTVTDVTRLYRIAVDSIATPRTTEEVSALLRRTAGPVTIGGGRYSMGGQTAAPGVTQLDLRQLRGVLALDTLADTVSVYTGTTWRALQEVLAPAGRAVKVMQTYNNFTVGGALSVNAHGRYIGYGPISQTVRSLTLVLANGDTVTATRQDRPELYAAALGGYGAVGVITRVTLDVARNVKVRRSYRHMPLAAYPAYFDSAVVRARPAVVFHNGDLLPPDFTDVGALTYQQTDQPLTDTTMLRPADQGRWWRRLGFHVMVTQPWGPALREQVIDKILWRGHPVTWRNLEASYDVSELEPTSRDALTYVLQEYFVPRDSLVQAVGALRSVLQRHDVKAVNISIRHALADTVPFLTWAPKETFALVLYHAQGTTPEAQRAVGVWTREAIDSVLSHGGRYYLPYQLHATRAQFLQAYPRARDLFALKDRLDPTRRFTNTLWQLYAPMPDTDTTPSVTADQYPYQLPAEVRLALDRVPQYYRASQAAVISHPEWDLVYSSEALRDWLRAGHPSSFPYLQGVATFWRSYRAAYQTVTRTGTVPPGFHSMLMVIGASTTVEYALTAVYEGTIGRISAWLGGHATPADALYATMMTDYCDLIHTKGWYEFDFWPYVLRLWQETPIFTRHVVRNVERRAFFTALWGAKAAYAQLLTWGLANTPPDSPVRHLVISGDVPQTLPADVAVRPLPRGYHLLEVPRYRPFENLITLLSRTDRVRLVEISGSPALTLTAQVPPAWTPPAGAELVARYPAVPAAPNAPRRDRVVLRVPAFDALPLVETLTRDPAMRLDHVYDF